MKRNEIEQLLPQVMQRTAEPGTLLYALLEVMAVLQEPAERTLARVETYLDPYHASDRFVPSLARWVDLERYLTRVPGERAEDAATSFPSGLGRLRTLIAAAADLAQWRGTAYGLGQFLEVATGCPGFEIDERALDAQGRQRPFHILVRAPAQSERYRTLIEQIIAAEKPAYVTCDLVFV